MLTKIKKNWDEFIPYVLFAYRASRHASTKMSPFYLLYGREPKLPVDWLLDQPEGEPQTTERFAAEVEEKFKSAWTLAQKHIETAQSQQKTAYDKGVTRSSDDFSVGDQVFVHTPQPRKGLTPKFQRPWHGPKRIMELTETNAKVLPVNEPNARPQWVHLNRLKLAKTQVTSSTLNSEDAVTT